MKGLAQLIALPASVAQWDTLPGGVDWHNPAFLRQGTSRSSSPLSFEALYAKLLMHCHEVDMKPTAEGAPTRLCHFHRSQLTRPISHSACYFSSSTVIHHVFQRKSETP